jgi:hypothetical protein
MKALLSLTVILVAVVILAPASFAAAKPQGITIITDTLGGNGHARLVEQQGVRIITDTLGGNGGPQATTVVRDGGFSWGDAGIGAAAVVGSFLLALGTRRVMVRRRTGLAV